MKYEALYVFNGIDITFPVCIQKRDVTHIIQERLNLSFTDAAGLFIRSKTCSILEQVENGLWAESAPYIADRFFEEYEANNCVTN